jgi:hypothetical protein
MKFLDFQEKLPPFIARKDVGRLLGGCISPKSCANLDSLGLGPEGRLRNGRLVVYETQSLLHWLDQKKRQ